jgi:hypothetical protein
MSVALMVAATLTAATGAARADNSTPCSNATDAPYSMRLRALTGPPGADLTVSIAATQACAVPETLLKVQLKTFAADGSLVGTRNLTDVAAPGGTTGAIDLGDVPRDRRIEADVLLQADAPNRTYVLQATTTTLLRPDLVVEEIAPEQTLAGGPSSSAR